MFVAYDMPSARAALKRALALDPASARVHSIWLIFTVDRAPVRRADGGSPPAS
jgi:hypothetical protein